MKDAATYRAHLRTGDVVEFVAVDGSVTIEPGSVKFQPVDGVFPQLVALDPDQVAMLVKTGQPPVTWMEGAR